ncbi:MAG: dihydroorotase, partial [Pseudomonadota bacterium]
MKIHIKNGRLIDPKNSIDAPMDVFVAAGKIAAVGAAPKGFTANRTIDASGLVVCPGLVDLAARLREPGFEYMATLESEMEAAIAGGVTSLACPPDTDPPLDEPGLVEMLKFRAKNLNQAHVYPVGALTQALKGARLTEMAELRDAGCVAFSQADAPLTDNHVLLCALQYAATFGFCVWLRPQDPTLARNGVAHDGQVATRLGLPAIPVCAETVALSTILLLARVTGARVHLCRLSSADGVDMVRQAKQLGIPVSCDIAIHHAHLSEMDVGYFDPNCHLTPPLRSARDRDALRQGLADGTVDAICSDHAP